MMSAGHQKDLERKMSTPVTDEDIRKKYTFYGRLNASFPSQIIMDTTEICNLACIHCPHPTFKKSQHYSGRCLEFELIQRVVDEVKIHGKDITQYIRYTGEGEPLLHPKIFEILTYSVKHSGTIVTLTTNGTLFNESKIEKLLDTGVNVIDISIDAFHPETYEKIRVNGDLKVTRANVINLIEAVKRRGTATKIVVSYVEQPLNTAETQQFESFWKEQGASFVVVRRLHSAAGAVSTIAADIRLQGGTDRRPCLYPWERIVINPRGELVFCPQDWVHGAVICDYRTTTLRDTWNSDYYLKLREAHLTSNYSNHSFCGNCPDWKQTRWPDDGRSYANMIQDFKAKE
jgi:pyruvate-formate lyase-activating enzyme